jgi:hypothetical protein
MIKINQSNNNEPKRFGDADSHSIRTSPKKLRAQVSKLKPGPEFSSWLEACG